MTLDWTIPALAKIADHGRLRELRPLSTRPGPVITLDGREVVNFSSNDYLSLAGDTRLVRAAQAAAARWGAGAGSSRLIAGNLDLFADLEAKLAAFVGAPAALLFPTGYHANLGVIPALVQAGDAVFSDRLNHASIIDGCRLSRAAVHIYDHADPDHLDRLLAQARPAGKKLVVTESVFSMEGDLAPLAQLLAAARKQGAMFMVDEAHALGVLGDRGRGGLELCRVPAAEVDLVMGTLGKALGSAGAFVAGSERLRSYLLNVARTFIFTTGPAPAAAGAALEAVRIVEDEPWRRERVLAHAERLRAALAVMGLDPGPAGAAIVPAVIGGEAETMRAGAALLERGLHVQGIRPPTVPEGSGRLRINLAAGHTDEQVDRLIAALAEILGNNND